MKKTLLSLYALGAYAIGMSSLVYMIGFLGNFYVPKSIDSGPAGATGIAVLVNLVLAVCYFTLHSIMARPGFKQWWTTIIPAEIERSTYVLVSGLTFYMLVALWQPSDISLWSIKNEYARALILTMFLGAWLAMIFATFNINHFSFFGLRQVWLSVLEKTDGSSNFSAKYLYRFSRHPISFCWLIVMWTTPDMTGSRLIFSFVGTVYIFLITPIEERDLANEIGEPYRQYQKKVRRFIPLPK